jgi:hypothetical protein
MSSTDFGDLIAERMRAEHRTLATRWFERLLDLLPVEARAVFPSDSLLDHIPALILEVSAYLGLGLAIADDCARALGGHIDDAVRGRRRHDFRRDPSESSSTRLM